MRSTPLALVIAASLALSPPVAAQSAQDRATARQLAQEADAKLAAKDLAGALELFTKADTLVSAPTLKLEIGRIRAQLGQLVEAQQALLDAVRTPTKPNEPTSWAQARADAQAEANKLTPRFASIVLTVQGPAAGQAMTVLIDGEQVNPGSLGVARVMNPGKHKVEVSAPGFLASTREIELSEGQKGALEVTLTRDVNALPVGAPPASGSASASASAAAPKPPPPTVTPKKGSYALAYGGFVAAGLGVAVGATMGLMSKSKVDELKAKCPENRCDPSLEGEASSARTLGNISTAAFAVGGVGAVVGIIGLFVGGSSSEGTTVGVGPGSIAVSGRF